MSAAQKGCCEAVDSVMDPGVGFCVRRKGKGGKDGVQGCILIDVDAEEMSVFVADRGNSRRAF